MDVADTALWSDARATPVILARTLDQADGFADVAAFLTRPGVRRVVATGNGAALYAAQALWLAALRAPGDAPEVVAAPAGLLGTGDLARRPGDALLVVSSSGELRDVVEVLRTAPVPYAAITSTPDSTIGAGAAARAAVAVDSQDAVTHTQAFVGNVAAALAVWALAAGDDGLRRELHAAPELLAPAVAEAPAWAAEATAATAAAPDRDGEALPTAAVVFGSGPAWAAALEAALLLKEVAGIPAEGLETREGATSGMYALTADHLVLSLPTGPDRLLEEAEATCARTGARLLRAPGGDRGDARLAAVTTFPAALALAVALGLAAGRDVDRPAWAGAYYATARVAQKGRPPAGAAVPAPDSRRERPAAVVEGELPGV